MVNIITNDIQESRAINVYPDEIDLRTMKEESQKLNQLGRQVRKIRPTTMTHRRRIPRSCQCRSEMQVQEVQSWPLWHSWLVSSTRSVNKDHEDDCEYAALSQARTNLQVRLSGCSMLLGRKLKLSIDIQRGAGMFNISPLLQTFHVVSPTSPAFALLRDMSFSRLSLDRRLQVFEDLKVLFDTGEATVYDRLVDGTTLLHVSFPNHSILPFRAEIF